MTDELRFVLVAADHVNISTITCQVRLKHWGEVVPHSEHRILENGCGFIYGTFNGMHILLHLF